MISGGAAAMMSVIEEDSVKLLQRLFVSYENRDKERRSTGLPCHPFEMAKITMRPFLHESFHIFRKTVVISK